jgi:hypothetical protein
MFMIDLEVRSHYAVLGVPPDATAGEIRAARDRAIERLRERQRREPANREQLLEHQKAVNAAGEELARPTRRAQYDLDNPHIAYLTARRLAATLFVERSNVETILRSIMAHLTEVGIPVAPLSDLDRSDFEADFTAMPLLDHWPSTVHSEQSADRE